MARVLIHEGRRTRLFELGSRASATAGRAPTNEIVVEDVAASREHCTFEKRGDDWWIVDLGSRNGTKLNGEPMKASRLRPGDSVEIGLAKLTFVTDESDLGLEESTGLSSFARSLGEPLPTESRVEVATRRDSIGEAADAIFAALAEGRAIMEVLDAVEKEVLARALEEAKGNRSEVARRLQLSRPGLLKKMKRLGLK